MNKYFIKRLWDNFYDIPNEIKWFIQRGKRGYADCDWWNLDDYISRIMDSAMLDLMYKGHHLGCSDDITEILNDPEARAIHNLYGRIRRFFKLHQLLMDNPEYNDIKELRRKYKASGLLFIRNFARLWD